MSSPQELPPSDQMADYVAGLFASGNFGVLKDNALKRQRDHDILGFIGSIPLADLESIGKERRLAGVRVRELFTAWKLGITSSLPSGAVSESNVGSEEVNMAEALTLECVADFAKERFERSKADVGRAEPDTEEFKRARKNADYWGKMKEFLEEAADSG